MCSDQWGPEILKSISRASHHHTPGELQVMRSYKREPGLFLVINRFHRTGWQTSSQRYGVYHASARAKIRGRQVL
jgi:hypothetical protein